MKYLMIGIIVSVLSSLVSFILWGVDRAYIMPGAVGFLLIGFSVVFSGTMVSGDRMRANFATETEVDRKTRNKITSRLAMLGLPNLLVAVLLYFFIH
ncbi:DUF5316 domain-containing protein [Bacillus salitolerans]|uniref:DUF5316 domain-containing protein n=1 Tax=Bacillus salitolerans TaxID=1437434 RepID=A0ABW4LX40_9BACI